MALPPPTREEYKALRRSGISHEDIVARMQGAEPTFTGAPDEPLQEPPFYADPVSLAAGLVNPPAALGGRAAVTLATEAAGAAGRLGARAVEGGANLAARAANAPIIRNIPFLRNVRGMSRDVAKAAGNLSRLGQSKALPAADEAAAAVGSAEARLAAQAATPAKVPASLVELTGAEIQRFPQLASFRPGETIRRAALEKIKLGQSASREAARAEGKAVVSGHTRTLPKPRRGPEVGSAASRAQRGASKPELARRAKALERVKSGTKEASKIVELVPKAAEKAVEKGAAQSRHTVRYFSESQGKHIDIEGMNQKFLEAAYRKLAAKNPKPGSVGKAQLDALLEEAKHRLRTTDIHVGQL